jgi:hypothetical protein
MVLCPCPSRGVARGPLAVTAFPQVREAFDEACVAVFKNGVPRPLAVGEPQDLLPGFAAHYQRLRALPRRTRRSIQRRWKRTLSAIALLLTLGQAPAWAATLTVSPSTPPAINADGKCSLIEAIVNANKNARTHLDCVAGAGPDTILLPTNSAQTLTAQDVLPPIASRIVIEGHGSTVSRNVSANADFFNVRPSGDLTLNKTTVTGANATSFPNRGLGVRNEGRLTLKDGSIADTGGLMNSGGVAVLTNSSVTGTGTDGASSGSGILNHNGGTLTLTNSVVANNIEVYGGGGAGIYNSEGSRATLVGSIVSQNRVSYKYEGPGGGILNSGSLTLVGSTISDNQSTGAGGGIYNSSTGTARVLRSTISNNEAYGPYSYPQGGGIANHGTLALINSTISNNVAYDAGGGGVSSRGALTILSTTVTGNKAVQVGGGEGKGGGVFIDSGTLTLKRSLVSGNTASPGREISVAAGVVTANDFNLFGHNGDAGVVGFTPGATDLVPNQSLSGTLLPLADNGGETRTHALAIASPALDASPDDATCPTIDQRENPRPQGAACDIGSFEGSAVRCANRVTTMVGTNGADELTGTVGADVISAMGGNDVIKGLESNDVICAGEGADRVYGGPGSDVLFGHGGDDTLNGGTGQDQCDGGGNTGTGDTATACETVSGVP